MPWDPLAAMHLQQLVTKIDAAQVTTQLRVLVQEVWRANVERHDPDGVYDDASTLGYTAFRNVSNRVLAEWRGPNGALRPAAYATWDNQSTVIRVDDIEVRLVKARVDRGRTPRFATDFRWETREGRLISATRNAERYAVPSVSDEIHPLFELPVADARERIATCTDVFVVWAGDSVGRTAGWYGLPTIASGSWLAVQPAWFDETSGAAPILGPEGEAGDSRFSDLPEAKPQLSLKRQTREGRMDV